MKEALCIQSTPADSRFNRDGGYELPDCWFALNRKLRGRAIVGHRAPLNFERREMDDAKECLRIPDSLLLFLSSAIGHECEKPLWTFSKHKADTVCVCFGNPTFSRKF